MLSRRTTFKIAIALPLTTQLKAMADQSEQMHSRTPEEVAKRCLALLATIRFALGHPGVIPWIRENSVEQYLSKAESKFIYSETQTQKERIVFSWRSEAIVPLLWALYVLDKLPPVNTRISLAEIVESTNMWNIPSKFLESSKLRDSATLLAAREDALEANWKARDAQLNRRPVPQDVDAEVAEERHHGFNWLVGDHGNDWDTIETDT